MSNSFFTRDEGSRLIQIIKSRVVEVGNDGKQKELDRIMCNAFASPGAAKYLNLSRKLAETISFSSGNPHVISPGSSTFQVLTPELQNSAVTEAKKWLEQKRLASGSKADFGCRSCSLNTNALQYVSIYHFLLFMPLSLPSLYLLLALHTVTNYCACHISFMCVF